MCIAGTPPRRDRRRAIPRRLDAGIRQRGWHVPAVGYWRRGGSLLGGTARHCGCRLPCVLCGLWAARGPRPPACVRPCARTARRQALVRRHAGARARQNGPRSNLNSFATSLCCWDCGPEVPIWVPIARHGREREHVGANSTRTPQKPCPSPRLPPAQTSPRLTVRSRRSRCPRSPRRRQVLLECG
jgi:hypothetical protein